MSKQELRILLKKVGKEPKIMNIENTLKAKQKLVKGLIEVISINKNILLICNEEGKIENLKPNLKFEYDTIVGDCFFIGDDFENAGFRSLSDEEIEEVKELLEKVSVLPDSDEKEMI